MHLESKIYYGPRFIAAYGIGVKGEGLPVIPILFGHADTSRVVATDCRMLVAVSQLLVA